MKVIPNDPKDALSAAVLQMALDHHTKLVTFGALVLEILRAHAKAWSEGGELTWHLDANAIEQAHHVATNLGLLDEKDAK